MILPKQHILSSAIVSDFVGDSQFQPAGVDMTLKKVLAFSDSGSIDFDNAGRKISGAEEIEFEGDWVHLRPGCYKVLFNEYVKIPADAAALCFPRSSLLRCGMTLECAVWDPGYEGRSEALLIVSNPHGGKFKRNAKVGQLVFVKLSEGAKELYSGKYQGENK
ncbi:MAG TPA: deoxyuridine 5'-triphosphate nucleotidohydrolase [Candidatus Bilamarchaeaceae archaeon]|nr:deoxyuridine 5'-triphosphate nucleotidohydrolase [Candidatus Bilamarchaeaceae archaeon]